LTRLITFIATTILAASELFRFPPDYRLPVCVIGSVAAVALVIGSLSTGKVVWALLFLGALGIFTPFRTGQLSHVLVSILDLATLALFASSSIMFRKSATPVAQASHKESRDHPTVL
jgi:hypothetical protein